VLGVVSALAGVLLHQMWWGLTLAVVVGGLLWWCLPSDWIHRFAYGLGWVLVAGLAATPRGAGDYLVPANLFGYAFLVWATGLAVAGLLVPRARRGADQSLSGDAT
jgi:hypothetical protein